MSNQNKETAIQNEQQLTSTHISQNLLAINMNLKSIATSLNKIASKGIDTFNPCVTTNN